MLFTHRMNYPQDCLARSTASLSGVLSRENRNKDEKKNYPQELEDYAGQDVSEDEEEDAGQNAGQDNQDIKEADEEDDKHKRKLLGKLRQGGAFPTIKVEPERDAVDKQADNPSSPEQRDDDDPFSFRGHKKVTGHGHEEEKI